MSTVYRHFLSQSAQTIIQIRRHLRHLCLRLVLSFPFLCSALQTRLQRQHTKISDTFWSKTKKTSTASLIAFNAINFSFCRFHVARFLAWLKMHKFGRTERKTNRKDHPIYLKRNEKEHHLPLSFALKMYLWSFSATLLFIIILRFVLK